MGLQSFPASSGGANYSVQPPASSSSVLWSGQLVSSYSASSTITCTGAPLYLFGSSGMTLTVNGTAYIMAQNVLTITPALSGSISVSASAVTTPVAYAIFNGATVRA